MLGSGAVYLVKAYLNDPFPVRVLGTLKGNFTNVQYIGISFMLLLATARIYLLYAHFGNFNLFCYISGTSDERWLDSDAVEEHQFSDLEDTEDDDDSDEDDEEDDDDDSQEERNLDLSPITATQFSPNELRQNPEIADFSSACQFSPQLLQTSEPLDKDPQPRSVPEHTRELPHRRWSPVKDTGSSSRPGPSRRHILQKREGSAKCFSPIGCTSPRRGLSPCHRLTSAREASPLRCISPQHLSPHRSLSPRAFMSPERGSSPPARHLSPSREMTSLRYSAFRGGLASPPQYPSPGREESHLSRSDAQIHFKAQHGVFPSTALPHRASGILEASGIKVRDKVAN